MVRMYSGTDELTKVRLYTYSIPNRDRYLLKVMCGMSKSEFYETPIIVTGYYQARRGKVRT